MDACQQPADTGPCLAAVQMWYFDQQTGMCDTFIYGGCQGNMNKFESKEECERQCQRRQNTQGVCLLQKDTGPCKGYVIKWYFDVRTRKCEQFAYGGCGGNLNNFDSKQECETDCLEEIKSYGICGQPMNAGPCHASLQRWYFSLESQQCERFYYGGCLGNSNNFESLEDCEERCLEKMTTSSICGQPMEAGPCRAALTRWYFNSYTRMCEQFTYGGCGGNSNNFESKLECEHQCYNELRSYGICSQPVDSGPCRASIQRWYFSVESGKCEPFTYGGCGGNSNNFESREDCRERCFREVNCNQPKDVGPCAAAYVKWYYNRDSKRCEKFIYGGCEGNTNRFDSLEECEEECINELPSYRDCYLSMEPGPCTASIYRWFYNTYTKRCELFVYGGCEGNGNNFVSKEACEQKCIN
ncbi:hypothetical protein M514_03687 [Trichuris suis]|uniref:BPTI/Kunitz inhibitor domain-containing protein n=1 Tax=Trichuris suis TaxID=68888 RepID=A0A085MDQ1_9BILA|nr:hypothetical protein M513_03687 [Trichuris suis]KFD68671.1 hypothetical protein M514_03687 [Trichuris suis]KHJ42596.1 Kunitz/Bovine pancreatic trypsin inhibitor domain protein [Trichuris suis]